MKEQINYQVKLLSQSRLFRRAFILTQYVNDLYNCCGIITLIAIYQIPGSTHVTYNQSRQSYHVVLIEDK